MADSIQDIKSSFEAGPIPELEQMVAEETQRRALSSVDREIIDINARIEAVVDLLVSLGFCKEQEYSFAVDNVLSTKPDNDEGFEDYLARRRARLVKTVQDAGLRE